MTFILLGICFIGMAGLLAGIGADVAAGILSMVAVGAVMFGLPILAFALVFGVVTAPALAGCLVAWMAAGAVGWLVGSSLGRATGLA
jgi:hypothetical protein